METSNRILFKKGLYSSIYTTDGKLNEQLEEGTIGFATFNDTTGTIIIKSDEKLFNLMPPSSDKAGQILLSGGTGTGAQYADTLSVYNGGTGLIHETIEPNKLYFYSTKPDSNGVLDEKMSIQNGYIDSEILSVGISADQFVNGIGLAGTCVEGQYFSIISEENNEEEGYRPSASLFYSGLQDVQLTLPPVHGALVNTSSANLRSLMANRNIMLSAFASDERYNIEAIDSLYCTLAQVRDAQKKRYNHLTLNLGNSNLPNKNNNACGIRGIISLYADNQYNTKILTRDTLSNTYDFYLPDFVSGSDIKVGVDDDGNDKLVKDSRTQMFAAGIKKALLVDDGGGVTYEELRDVGAIDTPTYVKSTGEIVPCNGVVMTDQTQTFTGVKYFANIYTGNLCPKEVAGKNYALGNRDNPWAEMHVKNQIGYGEVYTASEFNVEANELIYTDKHLVKGYGVSVGSSYTTEADPNTTTNKGIFTRVYVGNDIASEVHSVDDYGNPVVTYNPDSRHGELYVYGKGTTANIILARDSLSTAARFKRAYLPDPPDARNNAYLTWSAESNTAIGDANHPTYVSESGQLLACTQDLGSMSLPWTNIYSKSFILYDKNSSNVAIDNQSGRLYTTSGTENACGDTILELGNIKNLTQNPELGQFNNKQGKIYLLNDEGKGVYIQPRTKEQGSSNDAKFILPSSDEDCFAVWYDNAAKGSTVNPIYVDANGKICVADGYNTLFTSLVSENNDLTIAVGGQEKTVNLINSFSGSWTVPQNGTDTPFLAFAINSSKTVNINIPQANATQAGIVTTSDQILAGQKTFTDTILPQTSASLDLGSYTKKWQNLHINGIAIYAADNAKPVSIVSNHTNTQQHVNFYLPATTSAESSLDAYSVWKNVTNAIGSTAVPVYIKSDGSVAECVAYASGTQVSLNGDSKAGMQTSFYAPDEAGTAGQVLTSQGSSTTPIWVDQSTLKATLDANGKNIIETYDTITSVDAKIKDLKDTLLGDSETLSGTYDTLKEIHGWITTSGATAGSVALAISTEATQREGADKELAGSIDELSNRVTPVDKGGTGKSSWTTNGLIYASAATTLSTSSHYIDDTKISINTTSAQSENFYVKGSSKFNGSIIGVKDQNYGDSLPSTANSVVGQIFFKII